MTDNTRIFIRCPWIAEHSCDSGPSETVYFPVGNGYEHGHFHCSHASHAGKTDGDFIEAIGAREFFMTQGMTALPGVEGTIESLVQGVAAPTATVSPVSGPQFDRADTGKIKVLIKNVLEALRHPDWSEITVRYDTFRDAISINSHPFRDTDVTRLIEIFSRKGFGPGDIRPGTMLDAIKLVAAEHAFDSCADLVRSLVWDGVPRVATYCSRYFGCADTPYTRAVGHYIWTGLAGRSVTPTGLQVDSAIIFSSAQGTGKTSAVKAIALRDEHFAEIDLHGDRVERIRKMRGKTVFELAELSGLKGREAPYTKAFISATGDLVRDLYANTPINIVRRGLIFGTTNETDFLKDTTGNRRYYPIAVGVQDVDAARRDRDQLWAEGLVLFEKHGVMWKEACQLALPELAQFEDYDAFQDAIGPWLIPENGKVAGNGDPCFLTSDILSGALHYDHRFTRSDQIRVADVMRKLGYEYENKWIDGGQKKVWIRGIYQ